jgi:anti-sigma factor RsiW
MSRDSEAQVNDRMTHIESEALQAYLEGDLPEGRSAEVASHLALCARCAEELESWRLLFRDLRELPALVPPEAFGERVMARLRPVPEEAAAPAARPLRERLAALLPAWGAGTRHPRSRTLQELADGALAGPALARTQAHVEACDACGREVGAWRRLVTAISALPVLAPSAGFRMRVLAAFRAQGSAAPSPAPSLGTRLLAAAGALVPTTRRGWALATSVVAAPAVAFLALVGAVAAHPLLSVSDLFAFFGWQGSALARTGFSRLLQEVFGSGLVLRGYEAVQPLLASPAMLGSAALLTWLAIGTAGWVMYRNVFVSFLPSRHRVPTG